MKQCQDGKEKKMEQYSGTMEIIKDVIYSLETPEDKSPEEIAGRIMFKHFQNKQTDTKNHRSQQIVEKF